MSYALCLAQSRYPRAHERRTRQPRGQLQRSRYGGEKWSDLKPQRAPCRLSYILGTRASNACDLGALARSDRPALKGR